MPTEQEPRQVNPNAQAQLPLRPARVTCVVQAARCYTGTFLVPADSRIYDTFAVAQRHRQSLGLDRFVACEDCAPDRKQDGDAE